MGPNSAGALATANTQVFLKDLAAIPTGCPTVDQKLFPFYNGIPLRYITEMSGLPGTGKTSLAMQTCIQALALSHQFAVIYIDTACSWSLERFHQIYRGMPNARTAPITDFLQRIFIIRPLDVHDLFVCIYQLPELIINLQRDLHLVVKLIVVDNVASPFRLLSTSSIEKRIAVIDKLGRDLRFIAQKYTCAVICINQMTTKRLKSHGGTQEQYVNLPSLGQSWSENVDHRLLLNAMGEGCCIIRLVKSMLLFQPLLSDSQLAGAKKQVAICIHDCGVLEVSESEPVTALCKLRHRLVEGYTQIATPASQPWKLFTKDVVHDGVTHRVLFMHVFSVETFDGAIPSSSTRAILDTIFQWGSDLVEFSKVTRMPPDQYDHTILLYGDNPNGIAFRTRTQNFVNELYCPAEPKLPELFSPPAPRNRR